MKSSVQEKHTDKQMMLMLKGYDVGGDIICYGNDDDGDDDYDGDVVKDVYFLSQTVSGGRSSGLARNCSGWEVLGGQRSIQAQGHIILFQLRSHHHPQCHHPVW